MLFLDDNCHSIVSAFSTIKKLDSHEGIEIVICYGDGVGDGGTFLEKTYEQDSSTLHVFIHYGDGSGGDSTNTVGENSYGFRSTLGWGY